MINVALALAFGRDGNADNYLGPGWSVGEASELWLSRPPQPADAIFEVALHPHTHPPALRTQRLILLARGVELGRVTLAGPELCGWRIPAALLTGPGPVRLSFRHPDAAAPSAVSGSGDDRPLAFSVREARLCLLPGETRADGIATVAGGGIAPAAAPPADPHVARVRGPADLVARFASLGDSPEFGLFQRTCGVAPSGLLDLASVGLGGLLHGLRSGFAGLGEPGGLSLAGDPSRPTRTVRDERFGITYAASAPDGDAALLAREATRLAERAAAFIGSLARGSGHIHVVKRNDGLPEALVLPLYLALNQQAVNPLLWVVPADAAHPSGSVELLLPALLRGYIDRFAPYATPQDLSWSAWLNLCRNAYNLLHGTAVEAFPASPGAVPPDAVVPGPQAAASPVAPAPAPAEHTLAARGAA